VGQILPALAEDQSNSENGNPPLGISANTHWRRAIVDKKCSLAATFKLLTKTEWEANRENQGFYIRSGIVVV